VSGLGKRIGSNPDTAPQADSTSCSAFGATSVDRTWQQGRRIGWVVVIGAEAPIDGGLGAVRGCSDDREHHFGPEERLRVATAIQSAEAL
jgi:hypothetical protein